MSPSYWSSTAPGVQKVGGKSWFAVNVTNIALRLQALTATLGGRYTNNGLLTGALQKASAAFAGVMQPAGSVATRTPQLTAAFTGTQAQIGGVAAKLPAGLSMAAAGQEIEQGGMGVALSPMSAGLTGTQAQSGAIGAAIAQASAALAGVEAPQGQLAAALLRPASALVGSQSQSGAIAAALKAASVAMAASEIEQGAATMLLQRASAALTGAQAQSGSLATALQKAIAAIIGTNSSSNVMYDATTANYGVGTSISFTHNAVAGAYVLVDIVVDRNSPPSNVKHNGNPMTFLGSVNFNNNSASGSMYRYGIAGVAGGAQTITATIANSFYYYEATSAVNVTAVGTTASVFGMGTSLSQGPVSCGSGQLIVQAFGQGANGAVLSSLSGGTNRYNLYNSTGMTVNTATASATFAGTATGKTSDPWGGLVTVLS